MTKLISEVLGAFYTDARVRHEKKKTNVNLTFIGGSHYVTAYLFLPQRTNRDSVMKIKRLVIIRERRHYCSETQTNSLYVSTYMFCVLW
jgi:hypothetical protein